MNNSLAGRIVCAKQSGFEFEDSETFDWCIELALAPHVSVGRIVVPLRESLQGDCVEKLAKRRLVGTRERRLERRLMNFFGGGHQADAELKMDPAHCQEHVGKLTK